MNIYIGNSTKHTFSPYLIQHVFINIDGKFVINIDGKFVTNWVMSVFIHHISLADPWGDTPPP